MDEKQRAAMRNSFKRVSAIGLSATPLRLSDSDIKALSVIGITEPIVEPYAPVSIDEARRLLEDVAASYTRSKLDKYLDDAQNRVMEAIVKPFGLAKVLFDDKDGGNVTTEHNAKKDFYAREEDKYRPQDYRTADYRKVSNDIKLSNSVDAAIYDDDFAEIEYSGNQRSIEDIIEQEKYVDNALYDDVTGTSEYSGREHQIEHIDTDHIYPTNKYHQNGGFMQSKEQRKAFGSDPDNLAMASKSENRSMGDKEKGEWQQKEATDGSGDNNKKRHGHDNRRVNQLVKKGQRVAEKHLPSNIDKATYYFKRTGATSVTEGARMGLQQAVGALFQEIASAMMAEIREIFGSGIYTKADQNLISAIGERLRRVGMKVISKWKDIVTAFKEGAISGFLSNMVTVVINMFFTTSKNAVRMIREGFMSLVRGIKFILSPPEGYTKSEAFHEAGKVIIGGISVSLGIVAEEAVKQGIATLLGPFADYIAPVLVGIAVGLGTCFLFYLWDKLDLFGAEEGRRHKFIMDSLERQKNAASEAADGTVAERDRLVQDCDKMIADIEEVDRQFWALARA